MPNKPVFCAEPDLCIACGKCVDDCPAHVLEVREKIARPTEDFAEECLDCQHCMAICPTGAASVGGRESKNARPAPGLDPLQLDGLIRSRRSFRHFVQEPLDEAILEKIVETAAYAPTGVNARQRRFTIINNPAVLADFRDRSCRALIEKANLLPEHIAWLADAANAWLEKGRDVIFRGAPCLVAVTTGPNAATGQADAFIALSYLELAAQSHGLGTVWVGMVQYILECVPEARRWLNIPENHSLGYCMLLGKPAIHYARAAQWQPEQVMVVEKLQP
jgi:Nitroreductase